MILVNEKNKQEMREKVLRSQTKIIDRPQLWSFDLGWPFLWEWNLCFDVINEIHEFFPRYFIEFVNCQKETYL